MYGVWHARGPLGLGLPSTPTRDEQFGPGRIFNCHKMRVNDPSREKENNTQNTGISHTGRHRAPILLPLQEVTWKVNLQSTPSSCSNTTMPPERERIF